MLVEYLDRVRSMQPRERQKHALLLTSVCMSCILAVWGSVIYFGQSSYLGSFAQDDDSARDVGVPNIGSVTNEFLTGRGVPKDSGVNFSEFTKQLTSQGTESTPQPTEVNPMRAMTSGSVGDQSLHSTTASTSATSSPHDQFIETILQESGQ